MIRVLFALPSLVVAAFGQVAPTPQSACQEIIPDGGCSVCGTGSCISDQDAIFVFPGQPSHRCSLLQESGYNGQIPLYQCPQLPPLIGVCECRAFVPTLAPSPAPTRAPIVLTPPGACPEIPPEGGCSICGTGSCVTMPDAIFVFPGQPPAPCSRIQDDGFNGRIQLEQCSLFPFFPGIGVCECRAAFGPVAPIAIPFVPTAPFAPAGAPLFDPPPVVPTTRAPIVPTPPGACPEIPPEGGCSICGTGSCISKPDAICRSFSADQQSSFSYCSVLQDAGFNGQIPLDECGILPQLLGDCECTPTVPIIPPGACPEFPPEDGCSICGTGSCITNPDAIFVFPGQPAISCGMLQDNGFNGQIPVEQCGILPQLLGDCECSPTVPIIPPGACPEFPPEDGCSICGTGSCITNPDAIFVFPGQPAISCGMLQDNGFNGQILVEQCGILPQLLGDCECRAFFPTLAPAPPTFVPTWEPPPPTPARAPVDPIPAGACPEIPPEGGCSICGTGSCISKPDAIFRSFSADQQPLFSYCSVLQDAGFNGRIPFDECGILPPLIGDCECQPFALTAPIVLTLEPTTAPTSAAPTPEPRILMRLFSLAALGFMSLLLFVI